MKIWNYLLYGHRACRWGPGGGYGSPDSLRSAHSIGVLETHPVVAQQEFRAYSKRRLVGDGSAHPSEIFPRSRLKTEDYDTSG
jgi:hypothetical protein